MEDFFLKYEWPYSNLYIKVYFIQFGRQIAEQWAKTQTCTIKKVPRGLVGFEVRVPPYSRVLCTRLQIVNRFKKPQIYHQAHSSAILTRVASDWMKRNRTIDLASFWWSCYNRVWRVAIIIYWVSPRRWVNERVTIARTALLMTDKSD